MSFFFFLLSLSALPWLLGLLYTTKLESPVAIWRDVHPICHHDVVMWQESYMYVLVKDITTCIGGYVLQYISLQLSRYNRLCIVYICLLAFLNFLWTEFNRMIRSEREIKVSLCEDRKPKWFGVAVDCNPRIRCQKREKPLCVCQIWRRLICFNICHFRLFILI